MSKCIGCESPIPLTKRSDAKYCSRKCKSKVDRSKHKDVYNRRRRGKPVVRTEEIASKQAEWYQANKNDPERNFRWHKQNANSRGIPFLLTFNEWWSLWESHWESRKDPRLCMCREGDCGAYVLGNVRIDTQRNNVRECWGLDLL